MLRLRPFLLTRQAAYTINIAKYTSLFSILSVITKKPTDEKQLIRMKKIKIYQVDAFADKLFSGNPAAVCILDRWINEGIMQAIAAENNLAETAFVVPKNSIYEIRWFTPTVEVDLCGHATLAAAFVLFECLGQKEPEVVFVSPRSGELRVFQKGKMLYLDFPTDTLTPYHGLDQIRNCIGIQPKEAYRGKTDYIAIVDSEEEVRTLKPNFQEIAKLPGRGLIVTAKGNDADFVSRFFAPQAGINEDPVTGSAHTSLIPIWWKKLGKTQLTAEQLSVRGGKLSCEYRNDRCLIGGEAKLYMIGEINIE